MHLPVSFKIFTFACIKIVSLTFMVWKFWDLKNVQGVSLFLFSSALPCGLGIRKCSVFEGTVYPFLGFHLLGLSIAA